MALWRKQNSIEAERSQRLIQRLKACSREASFMPHNSFFISDGGGKNGIRIDYVERRQAAQRMRPAKEEQAVKEKE